ncbi:hypothetical protein N3K66_000077 [Trichothecium roseum]|uniref:Uncharacterized protein n=1 Tax=Trichothecium roseum TaxID=47278 RepID=A0ACC0VDK7_9HYPO|nr:hypothetical protein N3K66_000077 [Trichothecium roseum]
MGSHSEFYLSNVEEDHRDAGRPSPSVDDDDEYAPVAIRLSSPAPTAGSSSEPSLPLLPRLETPPPHVRKRSHLQVAQLSSSSAYNSSDPAFFTSEDDEEVDNYTEGQRKKRYTPGTWFQRHSTSSDPQETPRPPKQSKRTFSRQKDSGVWMDGDPVDDGFVMPDLPAKTKLLQLDRTPVKQLSRAEHEVESRIQYCMDVSNETIDLMGIGLEHLSNETIDTLSQFAFEPLMAKDVFFEHREPQLKLYLGRNSLTRVPGATFDLAFLTDLSLRGNELTEIPPAIAKLQNLRSLNISQNQLQHLPSAALHLVRAYSRLENLVLHPNPFIRPLVIACSNFPNIERPNHNVPPHLIPKWMTKHIARSPVQASSSTGHILSKFRLGQHKRVLPIFPYVKDHSPAEGGCALNKVPSLIEATLRAAYRSERLSELREHMPEDVGYLAGLLDQTEKQKFAGGQYCSSCGTHIIVPVLEWLEWRALQYLSNGPRDARAYKPLSELENENPVPFLHKACSWACGPSTDDTLPGAKQVWVFADGTYKEMRELNDDYGGPPVGRVVHWNNSYNDA